VSDPADAQAHSTLEAVSRWEAVVESAVDGIIVIDCRGRIESFNPAAERLFGYPASEILGENVRVLMPSPDRDEHDRHIARYLATGVRHVIGIGREVTGRRRDGSLFPLHLSVGEMVIGGERKFTGIVHDLTERLTLEKKLREQAALAKLGEMAAVVAHEVKNPLAGVRGAIQMLSRRLDDDADARALVDQILTRIDALNELMTDLLVLARSPELHCRRVDIVTLIQSTADLYGSDPAHAGVAVAIRGRAAFVGADPDLLKIVFLNLLLNAGHAMGGRGTIEVTVSTDGDDCRVAFRDSGPGIPPDVREKLFTPFFTTKSRGTGLGLVTARRLVEAHRGSIAIDCPESGGTVVTVQLPA
jgi:two-component system sensor kinase FixL